MQPKMSVTLEFEPIVKLACKAVECKHNLIRSPLAMAACNLKHVTIGMQADCLNYEPREKVSDGG